MSYVDAGYAVALGTIFVYAVGLGLRRRRWERALKVATETADIADEVEPAEPVDPVAAGCGSSDPPPQEASARAMRAAAPLPTTARI